MEPEQTYIFEQESPKPIFKRVFASEVPAPLTILLMALVGAATFFVFRNDSISYRIELPNPPEPGEVSFTYGQQSALSNPDFFGKVKQRFIDESADFIEADLSAMTMRVYKSGALELEVPIDSKGREGSWWETPAGLYKINRKEKEHFSGMGQVWMPWSMNFQGNFYIHGRTYHPDGTLTSREFTGGCIRLTTENAEKVYNLIKVGTPVLVFEKSFSPDGFVYRSESGPNLTASAYFSADLANNHVFATKSSSESLPIASLTKLMTALIATEYIDLDSTATVPKAAKVYTSKTRLATSSQYTVYQLLFPLLMESSNEAAETIGRHYGRYAFIGHMKSKAAAIGMTNSTFSDVSGADENNTSTAEDLFMLAKYIYNNRSFIFNITSGKLSGSAYGDHGFTDLENFNFMIEHPNFFGGKNGKTNAAGETNISVFNVPVEGTTRPIALIVLGSRNAAADTQKLLDYTMNYLR